MNLTETHMRVSEAAVALCSSPGGVYHWAARNGMGLVREGGEWWIPRAALNSHYLELEQRRAEGQRAWNERMQDPKFSAGIREGEEIIARQVREQEVARQVALKLAEQGPA